MLGTGTTIFLENIKTEHHNYGGIKTQTNKIYKNSVLIYQSKFCQNTSNHLPLPMVEMKLKGMG